MPDLITILDSASNFSRYTPSADDFVEFSTNLSTERSAPVGPGSELLWYGEGGASFIQGAEFSQSILPDSDAFSSLVSDHQTVRIGSNAPSPVFANIATNRIHSPSHTLGFPKLRHINVNTIHLSEGKYIEVTDSEIHIYPGSSLTKLKVSMGGGYKHGINRDLDSNLNAGAIKYANATNQGCVLRLLDLGLSSEYESAQFTKLIQKT